MTYEIHATRSDGMECFGTIDCLSEICAMEECKKIFRKFTAKGAIACPIHQTRSKWCYDHIGQTFTFSNHSVKVTN